jgi:hypothetical protein
MPATLLEALPDRRCICVLLRADGCTYGEIAALPDITPRNVWHGPEAVLHHFPGLLDHRRTVNEGR